MAYCKQCGKPIADDSRFCNGCGAKQDTEPVAMMPHSAAPASGFVAQGAGSGVGREEAVFHHSMRVSKHYRSISIMDCILAVILLYLTLFLPEENKEGGLGVLLILGVIAFAGGFVMDLLASQVSKNAKVAVCEYGVYGISTTMFSATPFELPYSEITSVGMTVKKTITVMEQIEIRTRLATYICSVREPARAVEMINKKLGK